MESAETSKEESGGATLDPQLFRQESGRMVVALTRLFGMHNLALAEDVVQDAFCRAIEVWKFSGPPANPSAWLMATAKHRAVDMLRRERTARTHEPELTRMIESEWTLVPTIHEVFEPNAIQDDQLRMMFSCCHPRLREDARVALILNILCGFSVGETAAAFVSGLAATEKRITRAKKVLATSKKLFDASAKREFSLRLPDVQRALYLLFNEGYHGASVETAVRADLCREALRLNAMLLDHPMGKTPATYALSALMSLHAARLPTRVDASGNLSPLLEQDRSQWDKGLIADGLRLLELSATGREVTEYHVEAAIAAVHAQARTMEDTDWKAIIALYDSLMKLRPSPIVALNRAIAVAQAEGPERGLEEMGAIVDSKRLAMYPFYWAALGELELRRGRNEAAREHFGTAQRLARNPMERRFLEQRVKGCDVPTTREVG
jgi:RNA polymerase sigma factor (sigma-70 family)